MRMIELEERAGTPRSTIHFYIQEGLLPAPEKPTPNSALYSEHHLKLLLDLNKLRRPPFGPLPLPMMKRVALRLRTGVSLEMALSLEKAVAGVVDPMSLGKRISKKDICKLAGVSSRFLNGLIDAGLVVADPADQKFDALDLEMTRIYDDLFRASGMTAQEAKPIVDGIRKISQREMNLRNKAIKGKDPSEASRITLIMEQSSHAIRNYQFYRARISQIAGGEKMRET